MWKTIHKNISIFLKWGSEKMTDNELKQIKLFALDELKKSFSQPTMSLWFEPMRVVAVDGTCVTISLPSGRKSFVSEQYYSILKQVFSNIIGFETDLKIISDEEEAEQLEHDETLRASDSELKRSVAFTEIMLVRVYKSFWVEYVNIGDDMKELEADLAEFLSVLKEKKEQE